MKMNRYTSKKSNSAIFILVSLLYAGQFLKEKQELLEACRLCETDCDQQRLSYMPSVLERAILYA